MAEGTLTREDFNLELDSFLEKIHKFEPPGSECSWKLHSVQGRPEEQFLVKQQLKQCHPTCLSRPFEEESSDFEEDSDDLDTEQLVSKTEVVSPVGGSVLVSYEYHVVYSPSFSVPVLFFNAHHSSGKLLSLDEIWSLVPAVYQTRLQDEKWTFITQQEHPALGRPFFMLHPCHTAELIRNLTKEVNTDPSSGWNYLTTWLSAVGPVLGLDLPLECGK